MTCKFPHNAAMTAHGKGCRCERCVDASREYHAAYREANRESTRARDRAWKKDNPDTVARHSAERRAREHGGIEEMSFEEFRAIKAIYRECQRISHETGIPHEVDHIQALAKGGKHRADNLQIITATANRRKGVA